MITVESGRDLPGYGSKTLIILAAVAAVVFIVVAALPYRAMFGPEDVARRTLQDFQFSYYPKRGWLLTHIAGGLIALLIGPVQLWLGLHNVKMHVHRTLGFGYIAAMVIGSIGGHRTGAADWRRSDLRIGIVLPRDRLDHDDEPRVRVDQEESDRSASRVDDPKLCRHVCVRDVPRWSGRTHRARAPAAGGDRHHGLGVLGDSVARHRGRAAGSEAGKR